VKGSGTVEFRVLGPLQVLVANRPAPLGGAKQRLTLAALLLHANEVVSADRLADILWGDLPPESALSTVQKYVYRLRAAIDPGRASGESSETLLTEAPGYLLQVNPGQLDSACFAERFSQARHCSAGGDLEKAAAILNEALGLWRGPAWAEFADRDFARADVIRLEALRALAVEDRIEIGLGTGRHAELIGEIEVAVAHNPLMERPRAQLMLALHRSGRQPEALRAYQDFRRYLADEVGLEPSAAMRRLEEGIVLNRLDLDWTGAPDNVSELRLTRRSPSKDIPTRATRESPLSGGARTSSELAVEQQRDAFPVRGRQQDLEWIEQAAAEPLSGEKRLLMVLFSDLVGSTELSASTDPEDYAEIVLTYQEAGRRIVAERGGCIANYLGDGLVAQFGYPVAHEDDADRALNAAIAIRRVVQRISHNRGLGLSGGGGGLNVRIAIHAGVTVVGHMGADERGDLCLFGETANISARVQSVAEPGQVLVTEELAARLRHEYVLADYGSPGLKGVERPVRVYAVMGEPTGRIRRATAPLVGRDDELGLLRRRLEVSRNGAGAGLVISGPAGVGKSRLVTALAEDVAPRNWLEARGSELASDSAFSVLGQLVARVLRLPPSADPVATAERLDEFLASHPLPAVPTGPLLATLTGESSTTPQSSESAFHAVVEVALHVVLAAVADLGHAVVVIEDLHWVDPSSRDFVSRLADAARTRRLLVILTERPAPSSRPEGASNLAEVIRVDPLDDEQIRQLLTSRAMGGIEEETADAIVRRAEGIPLFAEELARTAGQRSAAEIPYTLQASLLARLDRTPDLREIAQIASVAGTYIPSDVMTAVSGMDPLATQSALERLVGTGVLMPDEAAGGHSFRHSLIRDAVYASLLRPDRRRAHKVVAAALEELGVTVDRPAEVLAYHLSEGGESLSAARWFSVAALAAARSGACRECQVLCHRGLDLVRGWPEPTEAGPIELDLTMTLGNAANAVEGYGAPGQLELWGRAEELCIATGNQLERSSAMNGQAVAAMFAGNAKGAVDESRRIIEFGEDHGDRIALLRGYSTFSLQALFLGEVGPALESAEKGIDLYRAGDYFEVAYGFGTDHGVILRATAAVASTLCGRQEKSVAYATGAIDLAQQLDSPISLCLALVMSGTSQMLWEATGHSRSLFQEAETVARKYGLPFYDHIARLLGAGSAAMEGDPAAEAVAMPAVAALLDSGPGVGMPIGWWATTLAQEAAGNLEMARATAEAALDATSASGERVLDVELHRLAVRTGLASERIDTHEAAARLSDAAEWAAGQGMFLLAHRAQRDVLALTGDGAATTNLAEFGRFVESDQAKRQPDTV
jgi:class 3 adenylate cyclase/DNA-binding SARP family transcriptional activator